MKSQRAFSLPALRVPYWHKPAGNFAASLEDKVSTVPATESGWGLNVTAPWSGTARVRAAREGILTSPASSVPA